MPINPALYSLEERVVFFPVRHHSPTAARLVREVAHLIRPDAILIEGPSDFNPQIAELLLPHQLPIAIYSYVRFEDDDRRGAFYPFCVYSPEWAAIQTAAELNIPAQFIDSEWAEIADAVDSENLYADGALRQSEYIPTLCRELGVESFDDVWDTLFEIDDLTPAMYLERTHRLCYYMRASDTHIRPVDLKREAFMAEMIRTAIAQYSGRLLVVTGGFHSSALLELITQETPPKAEPPEDDRDEIIVTHTGIALTPYSYERLDSLRGYASGMPNPGFYHEAWLDATAKQKPTPTYRKLLACVASMLRERRQIVSAADLIAVDAMARSLADLRGHTKVWRRDLIDGVIAALVKDEFAYTIEHPFLAAVYELFRGYERGRLAKGTSLPPLVRQIAELLASHDLQFNSTERGITLALPADLERSRIVHQVRVLKLPGYMLTSGFLLDADSDHIEEHWRIQWHPEFEAACIEAAIYGPTLEDAARARLQERASKVIAQEAPDAATAVGLLMDAVLMGLPASEETFYAKLSEIIVADANFFTVALALDHLLYLYRFDAVLGVAGHAQTGDLLRTTFRRALWLFESLGNVTGQDKELIEGLRALRESYERCGDILNIAPDDFAGVFERMANDGAQTPLLRGAAHGVLWTLGRVTRLAGTLSLFGDAEQLGDFLTGMFALAREVVQREAELIQQIDAFLVGYDEDDFLAALPALRLAFSYFLPREKYYLTRTLFEKGADDVLSTPLEVDDVQAARALAFENVLFKAMARYGVLDG